MSPWGCEVDDHRFGLVLSVIGSVAGGDWIKPTDWFTRLATKEEALKAEKATQLANTALARFKIYSAERDAILALKADAAKDQP